MTACISVPWQSARLAGLAIAVNAGQPVSTKEAPEVGRVYFLVGVAVTHDRWEFPSCEACDVQYFWTSEEAQAWGDRDVERRLEEDE